MSVALRAAWRLLRSTVHVLHGLVLVLWRFGAMSAAEREATTRWWARGVLQRMGIALEVDGAPAEGGVLIVANHVSWLDVMAIHAVVPRARFVSKADVKAWPLLGRLIDGGGTLYLARERKRDALRVVQLIGQALSNGDTVAIFPEGTTSDGHGLLPFHANLLQAAIATDTAVQPIALRYRDASAPVSAAVDFVGEITLLQSLWRIACAQGVTVRVTVLAPEASTGLERRVLAQRLQSRIGDALRSQQQA